MLHAAFQKLINQHLLIALRVEAKVIQFAVAGQKDICNQGYTQRPATSPDIKHLFMIGSNDNRAVARFYIFNRFTHRIDHAKRETATIP
jgi:hypothetical protein